MKKRKSYSAGFKTKVVLEVLQGKETLQEISRRYELHPSQLSTWKSQFLSEVDVVFERGTSKTEDNKEKDALFKKVGQLQFYVSGGYYKCLQPLYSVLVAVQHDDVGVVNALKRQ